MGVQFEYWECDVDTGSQFYRVANLAHVIVRADMRCVFGENCYFVCFLFLYVDRNKICSQQRHNAHHRPTCRTTSRI